MGEAAFGIPWAANVGRLWFKYRSFSPLPILVLLVFLPADFCLGELLSGLVIVGILFAEGLRIWAVGHAGSVTRTRGEKVHQLVHAGPFRYVRNPLYIANIALYVLCCVLFGFGSLSVLALVYFSVQYIFIVAFEEEILKQTFGSAYEDYRNKVSRWLPSLHPRCPSSAHPFSLRIALRSERSSFFAIAALAVVYFLKVHA